MEEYTIVLMVLAAVAGLGMAWGIGANDVANAMGTSVGSGALTFKRAVIVAAIFEFAGAVLAGASVTGTIRKGIVPPEAFAANPELLVFGMIGALLAAAVWLAVATRFGWPVSTSHTIVGAIVGFACVAAGLSSVAWGKVLQIVASWITSPLLAGFLAFIMFTAIRKYLLLAPDPVTRTKQAAPFLVFGTTFVIALVTLWKGLKHLDLDLGRAATFGVAVGFGVLAALISRIFLRRVRADASEQRRVQYQRVEKLFVVLQVYTACAVAFAHGSNDVANAVGPLAAAFAVLETGAVAATTAVPIWMLLAGGAGIVVGLATYGFKVMETVGKRITELTPSRGYTAEFAAAVTIVLASQMGFPVSTTHTLVGAVLGIGIARGIAATNLAVVTTIAVSWVVTLPAGALLSVLFYSLLKAIF